MTLTADSPIADLPLPAACVKALTEAKITTVGHLTARTRAGIADTWLRQYLDPIDKAFVKHGLKFAPEGGVPKACTSCPRCPGCGVPRAVDARAVVVDHLGRAKHVGFANAPACEPCDAHHRALVADRAMELAGRLA